MATLIFFYYEIKYTAGSLGVRAGGGGLGGEVLAGVGQNLTCSQLLISRLRTSFFSLKSLGKIRHEREGRTKT